MQRGVNLNGFSWYRGNLSWLPSRTIFLTMHGSYAYGTNLPTSDLDLKGVVIPPRRYFFGFTNVFEQAEVREPVDVVIYDIRKFFKLAADCNPNIIEILFTDYRDWLRPVPADMSLDVGGDRHPWGRLWWNRDLFLSTRARHTFSGYAVSQLKRIRTHRNWLLNPPTSKPTRAEFGLKDGQGTLGKDQLGVINAAIRKREDALAGEGLSKDRVAEAEEQLVGEGVTDLNLSPDLIPVVLAERRYAAACRTWDQYQKWKAERNEVRSELEAHHGYDTKHAMHLVRLLRMAKEILSGQGVIVRRPDAKELLEIRAGAWKYEDLIDWAAKMETELATIQSPLPREPNRAKLDDLCVQIVEEFG